MSAVHKIYDSYKFWIDCDVFIKFDWSSDRKLLGNNYDGKVVIEIGLGFHISAV